MVNNAGCGVFGPLAALTDAQIRKQFATTLFGLLAVTRAVMPHVT